MRDQNTMTKWGYILENIIWSVFAIDLYKKLCFGNIFDLDDEFSKWLLYLFVGFFVILGVILTMQHRRNSVNTFANIAFPIAIYTAIAYFNYLSLFIIILLIVASILSVVYIIMTKKYSLSQSSRKQKDFSFKRFSILGTRMIVTSCTTLVVVYLLATTVTGIQLFRPESIKADNADISFVTYYENNADVFDKLEQNTWSTLNNGEKLDVLQVVCNAERAKLGIKEPIHIKSKVFKNNLLGEFVYEENTVLINTKHLEEDSSYSVLTTVAHECYHSYERSLVSLYDSVNDEEKKLMAFNRAEYYKKEFADYKDGENEEYYWQVVEEDARNYSEKAANDYKNKILSHLEFDS